MECFNAHPCNVATWLPGRVVKQNASCCFGLCNLLPRPVLADSSNFHSIATALILEEERAGRSMPTSRNHRNYSRQQCYSAEPPSAQVTCHGRRVPDDGPTPWTLTAPAWWRPSTPDGRLGGSSRPTQAESSSLLGSYASERHDRLHSFRIARA